MTVKRLPRRCGRHSEFHDPFAVQSERPIHGGDLSAHPAHALGSGNVAGTIAHVVAEPREIAGVERTDGDDAHNDAPERPDGPVDEWW